MKSIKKWFQSLSEGKKFKKEKAETRELPKGNRTNAKTIRIIVWSVLVIVMGAGILGFLRANSALTQAKQANAELQDEAEQNLENQEAYESPQFEVYANRFVEDYMNIPKDSDSREGYEENLGEYFVSDEYMPDMKEFEGKRELKNKTYYGMKQEENHVIAQYKVNYTIESSEDDEPTEKENMLNIPIKYDEGFAVVEPVFFEDVPSLENNEQAEVDNGYDEESDNELSMNEQQEVEEWVEDFFHDYAEGTKDDMAYMMDDPEGLNGVQDFKDLEEIDVYKEDNIYVAKVIANFEETEVNITHQEPYTLYIKQKEGKFYVQSMKQTLGGK